MMTDVADIKYEIIQLVVFALAGSDYGLHLETVERVIPTVAVTPLPKAPEIVTGIINLAGRIIPVLDIRRRFRLLAKEPGLHDHVIVARTSSRMVALQVDRVRGVAEYPAAEVIAGRHIAPRAEYVAGVVKFAGGLILIHDLETFLSLEEERSLDQTLGESGW
jgi:purine-binding chemotaxis protein CheW